MISVVITNYNGCHILKKCLPENMRVFKQLGITDIIVSDDSSNDDSLDYLKCYFPEIQVVQTDQNSGFSKTCNIGAEIAKEKIVLFFNNDMIIKKLDLKIIFKNFEDKYLFGCTPKILRKQDEKFINETPSYGYFKGGWFSTVNSEKMLDYVDSRKPFSILWGCGGALFVDKEKFHQLNGFDTIFLNPSYGEDLDLSYRAWKSGWKVRYEPSGEIFHFHQSTNKVIFTKKHLSHTFLVNQYLFMWKNITYIPYIFSHILTVLLKCITFQISDIKAICRALTRFKRVLSYRSQQKLFQKSDREILNQFRRFI